MIEVSKRQQKNEKIVAEFWRLFNEVRDDVAKTGNEYTFVSLYTAIADALGLRPMGVRTALVRNGLINEWKEWKQSLKLSQPN